MARISKKRTVTKKRSAKPAAITAPNFDSTNVESGDLVLINRNNTDYSTDVADLAEGIGKELGIDTLVGEINTEIGDITTEIGDINAIIGDGSGGGGTLPDQIDAIADDLAAHIVDNETRDAEIKTEQAAQDTAIAANDAAITANATKIAANDAAITANATAISSNEAAITANTASITKNTGDIAKLQGCLVFRGSLDVRTSPPAKDPATSDDWVAGDFIAASAAGTPDSAWNPNGDVSGGEYFAFNGTAWGPAGSNAVVIPEAGDGALTVTAADQSLKTPTVTGGAFTANKADATSIALAVNLKDKGGISVDGDGISLDLGAGGGITIDASGDLIFDPSFELPATSAPTLQAVTDKGASSTNAITVAGVVSTAAQSVSTFLHKNISNLPALADA